MINIFHLNYLHMFSTENETKQVYQSSTKKTVTTVTKSLSRWCIINVTQ